MLRRRFALPLIALVGVAGLTACSETAPPATEVEQAGESAPETADPGAPFVGNWELVRVERIGADGEPLPAPEPPAFGSDGAIGYIMYDATGHMGVVIMQPGRQPYAGDTPTPDEAVTTLASYTSYFGTYTVNEAEGYLTHHLQGNVRPPASTNDNQRFYEFSGDQLILMPPVNDSGVQSRIVWRRVPDLPESELTDTHRRLFGFYRFVRLERTSAGGESLPVDQWDHAFIIYMQSGHMAVHIVRPDRPVYTGAPTPEQALGALQTYGSYFGPFSVNEEEGYLVHHRVGHLNPGQIGSDAQRFYELTDTMLTLRPPPTTIDGQQVQTAIVWERLR